MCDYCDFDDEGCPTEFKNSVTVMRIGKEIHIIDAGIYEQSDHSHVLSIAIGNELGMDIPIKHCPFCGRKL